MTGAVVVRAGDREQVAAAGVQHLFALTGDASGGRLGVEEFLVPPATVGARPHVHTAHDECFLVLAGTLTVQTDDGDVELAPGDLAWAPRGALHGFANTTDTEVRALCLYTPAGYEQYFRDVHAAEAEHGPATPELLAQLRARYATHSPG
ncbi:cupin domain-containing protein [Modestobacter sp. Leaf380]|uniref:cupin domain-containing protein n=1 Tax=Modestobacter sp. Leaf380 TaxID=1736356 RepID=UPI0006F8D744|nr:cupin domain-containing protein [Modestobacter sp. Leaf380]KQS73257.1 hypothetical protein ASG41_00745 [Modestobacter sp. Leaf380]